MSIALFISFIVFLLLGIPISFCLAMAATFSIYFFSDVSVSTIVQKMFRGVDSFTLMAIPFFIFAGNIMARGGVSRKLTNIAASFVGKTTGGLAMVSTLACTFFGAISGSAPATTSAIGSIMVESMEKKGYKKSFSAATIAASGPIGLLIPPSNNMVLFGAIAGASIGELFLGGIVPGLMMAIGLMILEYVISKKRGYEGSEKASLGRIGAALKDGIWAILMPGIILGGIYGGIFTPTEAAAVAVVYGTIISVFVYKMLRFSDFKKVIYSSAKSTASIMYLVACAHLFSYILASESIPQMFARYLVTVSNNLLVIQLLMMLALLFVGTFLDNAVAVVLLTPIFYPVIEAMGGNLVYFGVLFIFALAIGQITPPVGLCLFVSCNIADESIERISIEIIPFVVVLIVILLILNFFPSLITFIPNISGI
ncbi:TRAP transporter large permease [Sediminispirochaeta smaragdinae]|uniref:TRAP dicarboxylate transporter, DctM subunit n=1 Tax=Sediminispirochaeta smaragdinae (strain DSM 11293 / JCM 15392 / SEBR 4228) TaxID=573413 RepID=E1RAL1_SEDSS|nr:TRAP transporter large permease [Sediminispirochaeta smaragdinae]ADK82379.1 TRAP dicarboxylate transporter, DctM subunit [Sediminispirochaeta smaragdinae DSM 11293]